MKVGICFLLLVLVTPRIVQQVFMTSTFKREDGWIFLDKMVLAPGTIEIEFETKVTGQMNQQIEVEFGYISDQFFETQSKYRCANAEKLSTGKTHVILPSKQISTTTMTFQNHGQHMYYFIMKDCKNQIALLKPATAIQTKLTIINAGSHLGSQQDLWLIYPLVIISSIWLIVRIMNQKPLQGQKNWVKIILFLGILTRISALFWKGVGYFLYWKYGKNYLIFQIFYLGMHGVSQIIIICIVILIGFGWYILFTNHRDFDVFISLFCLLGVMNVVLNILNIINDDTHDKYHMYDTIPSYIQTGFRILAFIIFSVGIKINWIKLNNQRKKFITKFGLYGTIYILSLPLTIIFSNFVTRQKRQQLVFYMSELFQLGSNILMTYLLTVKTSAYGKVNIENSSFLPDKSQKFF